MSFRFGSRAIGDDQPVLVIAEVGINHEGDANLACQMVEAAARAGADAIKLQTANPDENYAPDTPSHQTYSDAFLGPEETKHVFDCARASGVDPFTSTGMSTFDWVEKLQPAGYKISSGTLCHIPLIRMTAASGRPILMSTGIATHDEIDIAVSEAEAHGATDIGLMQCTSIYPCPDELVDLASIGWLNKRYNRPVGFSDHTVDEDTAAHAVVAGARFIEKHFSLTPGKQTFDHCVSLGPDGFRRMVENIRRAETLVGADDKPLRARAQAKKMRRYLVASRPLKAGETIRAEDVGVMRISDSDDAIVPAQYDRVIGAKIKAAVAPLAPLNSSNLDLL